MRCADGRTIAYSGESDDEPTGAVRAGERAGFEHDALLYAGLDEFVAGTREFIDQGSAACEPALVAVPRQKIEPLRAALGAAAERVSFLDMHELGRNPGRIIPEIRDWIDGHRGERCRFVGEPIWPGRAECETVEATRHEALINLAFADAPVSILCPYDQRALASSVLAGAARTHPHLICLGHRRASEDYADPLEIWQANEWTLPAPPRSAARLEIGDSFSELRGFAEQRARAVGLRGTRCADLVLAVNEAATNAVLHGRRPGELRIWHDDRRLTCEIIDHGYLHDPLAGRCRPAPEWPNGRGLWLINQVCDLVELRRVQGGTAIRLHVELAR